MNANLQAQIEILSPPGDTIQETIDALGMTQAELAERMGRPKEKLNDLIKGREPLTRKTALLLERVLGIPLSFWLNRENAYREEILRIEEEKFLESRKEWLSEFPVRELKKMHYLPDTRDKNVLAEALLKFYRVGSPEQWNNIYLQAELTTAFKISLANTKSPYAISAWLQIGEIKAQKMNLPDFKKSSFKDSLQQAKDLVIRHPEDFHIRLQDICADAGVALLFTPGLPKAPVSGATWWRGKTPIIQLTDRYKMNDNFWFAFYHEAGHIIEHGKKDVFLEDVKGSPMNADKEREADVFAQRYLFPEKALHELASYEISRIQVLQFAKKYNTHPGIVVGQLQHAKIIGFDTFNEFKVPVNLFDNDPIK